MLWDSEMRSREAIRWLLLLLVAGASGACHGGGGGGGGPGPFIELAYVDEFEQIAPASNSPFVAFGGYWRPVVPSGFHALGHYAGAPDENPPRGFVLAARELTPGALASPVDYELVRTRTSPFSPVSIWRPLPPAGYICLGLVASPSSTPPQLDAVQCVREDLAAPGMVGNTISLDGLSFLGGPPEGASWQVVPADGNAIYLGTFTSTRFEEGEPTLPPTDSVFVIDASSVMRHELSSEEVHSLVQTHGPVLWIHSDEEYLPDDPAYVLDYLALVWGLVENEWDYDNHSFDEHGFLYTSAAGLMTDVEENVENDPDFGNPSFRQYLHIDDGLKPGSLDRARALIRVRPWNWLFTDVQFWLFYPFNGPGRVEVCTSSSVCDEQQLVRSGRHYGDWEHVTLRFSNSQKEVVAVYMSRHAGSQWLIRSQFPSSLSFDGTHPEVFAGFYSHAHYPSAGFHAYERVFEADWGLGTASADLFDRTNRGHAVPLYDPLVYRIVSSELPGHRVQMPDWLGFAGRWGQYERLREGVYFGEIRFYTNEEVGAGPSGPPFKVEWQRGDSSEHWWWTHNLEGNEACFDGIDNDGDQAIDCADSDCSGSDPLC